MAYVQCKGAGVQIDGNGCRIECPGYLGACATKSSKRPECAGKAGRRCIDGRVDCRTGIQDKLIKTFRIITTSGNQPDVGKQLAEIRRCRSQAPHNFGQNQMNLRRGQAWRGYASPVFTHPLVPPHPEAVGLVQNYPGARYPRATGQGQVQPGRYPAHLNVVLAGARAANKPTILNTEMQIQDDLPVCLHLKTIATGAAIAGRQFKNGPCPEEDAAEIGIDNRQIHAGVQFGWWRCRRFIGFVAVGNRTGDRCSKPRLQGFGVKGTENRVYRKAGPDWLLVRPQKLIKAVGC